MPKRFRFIFLCAGALAGGAVLGCGSSASPFGSSAGPVSGETTQTSIVVSSAANNHLVRYSLELETLTLTDKDGQTVSLLSGPLEVEFMHLNGGSEPLLTVTVPQGVYTWATATAGNGSFSCAAQQSDGSGDLVSTYAYSAVPNSQVTVQLPEPLSVAGNAMTLSLQLLVSQSASFPSTCYEQGAPYSISPTFSLSAMRTGDPSGKLTALEGLVKSVGSTPGTFTVTAADSAVSLAGTESPVATWTISTSSATVFQGVGNAEGLAAGMPVDLDGTLQPDGSLAATRVAVPDSDTANLTVNRGPLMEIANSVPLFDQANQQHEGPLQNAIIGWPKYNFSNTSFAIWGGLSNLARLPFSATFAGANMVPGQMVAITTHATSVQPYPMFVPATTMTLMPQTIDGTVQGVGTAGGFTTYTVQLAPYDFFPTFAVQPGQTTLLRNAQQIVVYADSNTQIDAASTGVGSVVRFSGVIFNDNGTLRMDCYQLADGVSE